jgi:hypothetical protein
VSLLKSLGYDASEISWIESFVTDSKLLCLCQASLLEKIQEHDHKEGGGQVFEICSVIDPAIISSEATFGPNSVTPDVPDDGVNPNLVPWFMVERSWPGAGAMSHRELQVVAERIEAQVEQMRKSSSAPVSWIKTYITPDKVFEVYEAANMASACEVSSHDSKMPECILCIRSVVGPSTIGISS